ncbi:MAG: RNA polymerase sigma factor, partial [Gemmataceae bacterium]
MADTWAAYTDEDLLARLRSGKSDGFAGLVRRYEREIFGYLRRYLGSEDLAADVFQNTFLAIYKKIAQYEPGRPARPWIYAIATNQAIDAMRRKARRERLLEPLPAGRAGDDPADAATLADRLPTSGPDPAAAADLAETRDRVRAAVDNLPELLRQVILLAYFQGMKYQDIADTLGVPVG